MQTPKKARNLSEAVSEMLFSPVDVAPLVWFRVLFGLIMAAEVGKYFFKDHIGLYFVRPRFHFTYYGFEWIRPIPGAGMYVVFGALLVSALCIALGYRYRANVIIFFLGFSYVFLLEKTLYLNHYYLIALISLLLIFLPANRTFSLDARAGRVRPGETVPAWSVLLPQFQIALVYFFGGIAKLNGDWLRGEPMRSWLQHNDFAFEKALGTERLAMALSYGGVLFDLSIIPLLIMKKTRWLGAICVIAFHVFNGFHFNIGVFPAFMLVATITLFPLPGKHSLPSPWRKWPRSDVTAATTEKLSSASGLLLASYVAFQLLFPFRYLLYPGNVLWTEQGARFSWRMLNRNKLPTMMDFTVRDLTSGATGKIIPGYYLTRAQLEKMPSHPDMIVQFARHVAHDIYVTEGKRVAVYANIEVALNGRPSQPLIDNNVDLASKRLSAKNAEWILPLTTPLPIK
jgi:vitamin K-dependent gamma-carboxylase